jgi:hypothetical protein
MTKPGKTYGFGKLDLRDRLTRPLGGNDGVRTAELAQMLRELLDAPEADR